LRLRDGNPVEALRDFLDSWWLQIELDAMLAPVELPDGSTTVAMAIEDPSSVGRVNPFAPVMVSNSAAGVERFARDHPGQHIALLLRPCELRALRELQKRDPNLRRLSNPDDGDHRVLIICVDCPGTFPASEYERRIAEHRTDAAMIRVGINYQRQQSYAPPGVRLACQLCDPLGPLDADVTIGTLGVVPQDVLLVIASDEKTDQRLRLSTVTDGLATEQLVEWREIMLGKFTDTRAQKRAELLQTQLTQTENFVELMAAFARCTLCADCLDACPLYRGELTGMLGVGETRQGGNLLLPELVRVSRWLASCAGCGMCQEACGHAVPLMPLITAMRLRIQKDLHYQAGSASQPLPWTV
jgi:formate dehydrogenase subunit beta